MMAVRRRAEPAMPVFSYNLFSYNLFKTFVGDREEQHCRVEIDAYLRTKGAIFTGRWDLKVVIDMYAPQCREHLSWH